jgi:hypothetical protein
MADPKLAMRHLEVEFHRELDDPWAIRRGQNGARCVCNVHQSEVAFRDANQPVCGPEPYREFRNSFSARR